MIKIKIKPGLTNEMTWRVERKHLASAYGSGLVDVLATPVLVGLCEECARKAVDPLLPEGQKTVGTSISLRHLAATPPGMHVTVKAELIAVDKRRLTFCIEAWDEQERVGKAEHERFIIDIDRFEHRVAEKANRFKSVSADAS
jgi:predicted thioesterase